MIQNLQQHQVKREVKIMEVDRMPNEKEKNEENKKKKRRLEKLRGKRNLENLRKNVLRKRK